MLGALEVLWFWISYFYYCCLGAGCMPCLWLLVLLVLLLIGVPTAAGFACFLSFRIGYNKSKRFCLDFELWLRMPLLWLLPITLDWFETLAAPLNEACCCIWSPLRWLPWLAEILILFCLVWYLVLFYGPWFETAALWSTVAYSCFTSFEVWYVPLKPLASNSKFKVLYERSWP